MIISKFFYFTISGDDFDIDEFIGVVPLYGKIYRKDETITQIYNNHIESIPQKTNRWVYSDSVHDCANPSGFLTKNLEVLYKNLRILKKYINTHKAKIEYNIYAENRTDIKLSKKQISLLCKIGVPFYISFC